MSNPRGIHEGRPCVAGDPFEKEEWDIGAAPPAGVSMGMVRLETMWVFLGRAKSMN